MIGVAREHYCGLQELPVDWAAPTTFTRDALTKPEWPTQDPFRSVTQRPDSVPAELTVEYWFARNRVDTHPNAQHVFKPRKGLLRFEVVDEGDDSRKSFKRLHRHRYSPTACYGNNEVHLHPTEPRRISVAEALALQSLPAKFELPNGMTLTDMFKTVGNGVPYLAARGIARTVAATLASL